MNRENEIEQALSRTVRSSLDRFERTAEELHHAVNDLAAACSSARVANTLPPMMRAQMAAASLAASLEALARFVTSNLPPTLAADVAEQPVAPLPVAPQPVTQSAEPPIAHASEPRVEHPVPHPVQQPVQRAAQPAAAPADSFVAEPLAEVTPELDIAPEPAQPFHSLPLEIAAEPAPEAPFDPPAEIPLESAPETRPESTPETVASLPASELLLVQETVPADAEAELTGSVQFTDFAAALAGADSLPAEAFPDSPSGFDLSVLPAEVQELHRRANRVAKVSMQDIKLLRPEDVRLGQEHRDLCFRLREDLERAHKEYDRRFQTILGHPVDYFYDWLVEILAQGDPQLLGEYPYPSPAMRR